MDGREFKKRSIGLILPVFISAEVAFVSVLISGPTFLRIFSLSSTQLGFCMSSLYAGMLIMSAVIGNITWKFGGYRVFVTGICGVIAGWIVIILADSMAVLSAGIMLTGMFHAALHNGGTTLLTDIFSPGIRKIMALAMGIWFGSSVVSSPLIGRWLSFAHEAGFARLSYGVPGAAGMALLAGCLLAMHSQSDWKRALGGKYGRGASASRARLAGGYGWVLAIAFFNGLMVITFISWVNQMIQTVFGTDDFRGSMGFAAFALGIISAKALLAFKKIHADDRLLVGFSGIAGGAFLAISLLAGSYAQAVAAIAAGAFLLSATGPCLFSIISGKFPEAKSRLLGYQLSIIAFAGLLGPFAVGFLADRGVPLRVAMMISPIGGAAMGIIALVWLGKERGIMASPAKPADGR